MNNNAICLLVNNLDYIQAFIRNLPTNIDKYDLVLINETRIGNKIKSISKITEDVNNVIILDSQDIVKDFKENVLDNIFVDVYTMGMNILAQWYLFKNYQYNKVLFLDDDVLINEKIDDLFNNDKCMFYKFALSCGGKTYYDNNTKYRVLIKTFGDIYNLDINENTYREIWKANHLANGQRLYYKPDFDIDKYTNDLSKFFSSEILKSFWTSRTMHTSYHLDEWFESLFAYTAGIINDDLKKYTYIEMSDNKKVDISKYNKINKCAIWHNATASHKTDWLVELKRNEIIK